MAMTGPSSADNSVAAIAARAPHDPLRRLHDDIRRVLHAATPALPYHGWPHVKFVTHVGMGLALRHGVDGTIVGAACLVHDLNYLSGPQTEVKDGLQTAVTRMESCGFDDSAIAKVTEAIQDADLRQRGEHLSDAAACLSDADSLFKALPATPLLLARAYLSENRTNLRSLAEKIVSEQAPLLESGIYFYFPEMRQQYDHWARENVAMWRRVLSSFENEEIATLYTHLTPEKN